MLFRQASAFSAMSVQPSCSPRCLPGVGGRRGSCQAASVRLASSNSGGLRHVCPSACSSVREIPRSPLDHRPLARLDMRGCNHSRKAVGTCILFDGHQLSYVRPSRVPSSTTAGEPVYDLVLSSGFLAFANHSGFLAAVEEVSGPPFSHHWPCVRPSQPLRFLKCDWTNAGRPESGRHHGHKRWGARR